MARIRVLSENIIHKIAAGEVIEGPSSVVKELVENSLDAEARRVRVEIREGGRHSIVVTDDGVGMDGDDLSLSVQRHATSKLASPTDLFAISTLGFRGEALASIGAVSRMTIETCSADSTEGTRLVVEGGIQRELGVASRATGTTITVQSLFFNTPARRKFLRHLETETRYVTQSVSQLAAAYPSVAFELEHQGRTILDIPPGSRLDRASDLLGLNSDGLIEAKSEVDSVKVHSFFSTPGNCRRSKNKQYLLVRDRPVFSRNLTRALYAGYGGLIRDAHPAFVLWLDLPARSLDVNVHPAKRQVKFAEERSICDAIRTAVRDSLAMPETRSFTARGDNVVGEGAPPRYTGGVTASSPGPSLPVHGVDHPAGVAPEGQMALSLLSSDKPRFEDLLQDRARPELTQQTLGELSTTDSVWQIHDKYILASIAEGLLVIDQHVAHERVRYEEALDRFDSEGTPTQQLLLPLTIDLSATEMEAVREAQGLFERLGFVVRDFGPGTVLLDSMPSTLKKWDDGKLFHRILIELLEEKQTRDSLKEAVAASYACHTSIRAGERINTEEMKALIFQLLNAREPFVCPHGRPIMIKIPVIELDRMFDRL